MIKKTLLSAMVLFFTVVSMYAQKVDLDREYIKVKYVNLPSEPIQDASLRTYVVKTNARDYDGDKIIDGITLHGFEKRTDKGTVTIDVSVEGVMIEKTEIAKREVENKDKEGNVTSVDRYYTPKIYYETKGRANISNEAGEGYSYRLGGKSSYSGSEYSSYSKASEYLKNNRDNLKDKFQSDFINGIPKTVSRSVNRKYGYPTYVDNVLFWILDSKKNPEYQGHKDALANIKTLLGKIKANESIEGLTAELKPIEDYFLSVIPKFPTVKKKKHRKMRYASYYNLGKLYYYLDMPDKAIEYANKVIENNYDKGDGKRLIKDSEALKKMFGINKVKTTHFPVNTSTAEQ